MVVRTPYSTDGTSEDTGVDDGEHATGTGGPILKTYCCEKGRSTGDKTFTESDWLAPVSLRQKLLDGMKQRKVWSHVQKMMKTLNTDLETKSLDTLIRHQNVQSRIEQIRRGLVTVSRKRDPETKKTASGVLITVDDQLLVVDLFAHADHFRRSISMLAGSYGSEIAVRVRNDNSKEDPPRRKTLARYLRRSLRTALVQKTKKNRGHLDLKISAKQMKGRVSLFPERNELLRSVLFPAGS